MRYHLMNENRDINILNYMSNSWESNNFKNARFIGFLPITGTYRNWGAVIDGIDGIDVAAVHLFETPNGWSWGDDPRDTIEYSKTHPWVLMFKGSDNYSRFMRFRDRESAFEWLDLNGSIEHTTADSMFYNS